LELNQLKANIRTTKGNSPARALRRSGNIPAVLYGPKTEPVSLSVNTKEFEDFLKDRKRGEVLLNLTIEDEEKTNRTVMLREIQKNPFSRKYIHADFYEVPMDRKIRLKVPVTTTGKPRGVEMGGMLQIIRRDLEVLCYPDRIPEVVELDVTELDIGDAIHIKDVPAENDVEFPADVNFTVLTVLGKSKAVEVTEGEEEEAEDEAEENE